MGVLDKVKKLVNVGVYIYAGLAMATCSFRMQLEQSRSNTIAKQAVVIAAQRSYIDSLKCKLDGQAHPNDAFNCPEARVPQISVQPSTLALSVFGGF